MNFPQTNTVHYHCYRNVRSSSSSDVSLIDRYQEHLSNHIDGYIWHNECFHLKQKPNNQQHLFGQCNYGENVEDEWFIVYLLKLLTEFDEHLFVRIQDEDGEFLLIESAEHLPEWAQEPRHTIDRVFIHRGNIHLVPCKYLRKDPNDLNTFVNDCMNFIECNPKKTLCNESVQQCIRNRIERFSNNKNLLHHNAHCLLPISLAILLDHHPDLIAAAVRAFYYRTPDDVKIFGTHCFHQTMIITNVRFNRCLYAQLTSQD
ncbi:SGT1-like protein ecdysoneless-like protein, partial [Euroglyphus maynei]